MSKSNLKFTLSFILIIVLLSIYFYWNGNFEQATEIPLLSSLPLETSPAEINRADIYDVQEAFRFLINQSKKSIMIAGLYFTVNVNWRIKRDLKRAIKRGVRVEFLLEDSVFARNQFSKLYLGRYTNVDVRYINVAPMGRSKWGNFHNKYAIFDKKYAMLGSANFSYPALNYNVEINAVIIEPDTVEQLVRIFRDDYNYATYKIPPEFKIFSYKYSGLPDESIFLVESGPYQINHPRVVDISNSLNQLLSRAKNEIDIQVYAITFGRNNFPIIYNALLKALQQNVDIKLLIDAKMFRENKEMKTAVTELQKRGVKIKKLNMQKLTGEEYSAMHAKMLIVDRQYLFLGSSNWSKSGMQENREIGIITTETQFVQPLYDKFHNDWNSRYSEKL
ncbi:MAG: phosphatidylserine/phosphatidylglycerophosphate/cardiolipin synthase family protein [Spirochaetes bacterium]|nr:phosphatidylserine/phosphatidylglycerophosphate/cardiolipin synthase family protein [Spirochaetota bacterium]